jgi:hypothetical protein
MWIEKKIIKIKILIFYKNVYERTYKRQQNQVVIARKLCKMYRKMQLIRCSTCTKIIKSCWLETHVFQCWQPFWSKCMAYQLQYLFFLQMFQCNLGPRYLICCHLQRRSHQISNCLQTLHWTNFVTPNKVKRKNKTLYRLWILHFSLTSYKRVHKLSNTGEI